MRSDNSCSRPQPAAPDVSQPSPTSIKKDKPLWKSLPITGIGLLVIFAFVCAIAIKSPNFKGVIGFKITPHGIEFQIDRQ